VSGRVIPLGTDIHSRVQALLPWYVRGSLDIEERARIEAHLGECALCQAELAWERRLHVADDAAAPSEDVERDLALLRERLVGAAVPARQGERAARLPRGWRQGPAWLRWALVAQCAVIATLMLGLFADAPSPEQRYRALGRHAVVPVAGGGNLVVRFRPETTEQQMRQTLRDSDARLVYGPTTTDAYVLSVPAERVKDAIGRLRAQRTVLLVESLDGAGAP